MFVQHIWNLFQLLGLVTCRKLANLSSRTLSLKRANNILKLPGVDYVAKNWALAMMLKALPLVHFWNVLLLKEQMMTSLRKICLANNHKIGRFLPIAFWWSLPPNSRKITAKSVNFSLNFVPKNPAKNGTFSSVTYQKPLQIHIWNPWLLDLTLICVISMEFLSLSRRCSSARNVPAVKSAEKRMFLRAKVDCVAYKLKLSWKLQFLWWKTRPYDGFEISKFCGGAQSQTQLKKRE